MRAWSFQVNSYDMGFGISYILHCVCGRITPNSLAGGSSFFFGSPVRITELKFGAA